MVCRLILILFVSEKQPIRQPHAVFCLLSSTEILTPNMNKGVDEIMQLHALLDKPVTVVTLMTHPNAWWRLFYYSDRYQSHFTMSSNNKHISTKMIAIASKINVHFLTYVPWASLAKWLHYPSRGLLSGVTSPFIWSINGFMLFNVL